MFFGIMYIGTVTMWNIMEIPNKRTENRTIIWPSNTAFGIYTKGIKLLCHRRIYNPMFTAAVFTILKIRRKPSFIDWWVNKENVMGTHNGIFFRHKKKDGNLDICTNVDEIWGQYGNAKWNKLI